MTKKPKSLEKEIDAILRKYYWDPYAKEAYIENCSRAIVKKVEEMMKAIKERNEERATAWEKPGAIPDTKPFRDGALSGHRWANDIIDEYIESFIVPRIKINGKD